MELQRGDRKDEKALIEVTRQLSSRFPQNSANTGKSDDAPAASGRELSQKN